MTGNSGISWTISKSFQTDNHASTSPFSFYRSDALLAAQPTASKHWRNREKEREREICNQ